jgi:hypothetical protein
LLIALIFILALGAAGPWPLRTGTMALALGILMGFAPPVIRFRKPVVFLSAGFLIFGLASFLPAGIFGIPGWRENLKGLGVETGDLVAIQSKQALEYHLSFLLLFLSGLWILGQRFSASATRNLALTFVLAVAAYALVSKLLETQIDLNHGKLKFGFFPNRNHTSNLLSAGFLCGLGIVFQSVRNKNSLGGPELEYKSLGNCPLSRRPFVVAGSAGEALLRETGNQSSWPGRSPGGRGLRSVRISGEGSR